MVITAVVNYVSWLLDEKKGDFCQVYDEHVGTNFEEIWKIKPAEYD